MTPLSPTLFSPPQLESQPELFIHLIPDKKNNTLTIVDSGIGMTKAGELARPRPPPAAGFCEEKTPPRFC